MLVINEWTIVMVVVLGALALAGIGTVFVGKTIERDARAGTDNEYNRLRERSGGRFITAGAFIALPCLLAFVLALLMVAQVR